MHAGVERRIGGGRNECRMRRSESERLDGAVAHVIGFYVCPGHQLIDLAGPLSAFEAANRNFGCRLYDLVLLSSAGSLVAGSATILVDTQPAVGSQIDTLVIVGGEIAPMLEPTEVGTVRKVAGGVSRVASVCSGAFLLAEAGLLDERRATTHWQFAHELQRRYPRVKVDADRIFVNDGHVWTSAGTTAGIDLALALVEADHGVELTKAVSRELVVYHRRPGGQSQYAAMSQMEPESDRIRKALTFARDHLSEPLSIERLAAVASLSVRQFGRLFRKETGETPARAVARLRSEAARLRLQEGSEPVEYVARAVGFADPERMRRAFLRHYGQPPQMLRRSDGMQISFDG